MSAKKIGIDMIVLYITIFGMFGVLSRYFLGLIACRFLSECFPYGTAFINFVGSFLIGIVYVMYYEMKTIAPVWVPGIMIGFLGGFTTFSSYSLETFRFFQQSQLFLGWMYFIFTPILGLGATFGGVFIARWLLK